MLNLQTLPTQNLNIRANVTRVGSVRFALDGNSNYNTENGSPYALASDYYAWTPSLGQHTLTATVYSGTNASGSVTNSATVNFTVVNGSGSAECSGLEKVYVDTGGADSNPGTADQPFRTLNKGLDKALTNRSANQGTCVLLQPGTYREGVDRYVDPSVANGPRIVIESVVPGEAVVAGSEVWTNWSCSSGVCSHDWSYNWGTASYSDVSVGPLARRREMVVVNGANLNQYMSKSELTPGSFSVDEGANKIYVKPPSGVSLNSAKVEVAVRGMLFKAGRLNDLTLRGLVFQHAATPFRVDGAVMLTSSQSDVLLEDVLIQWNGQRGLFMTGANYTLRDTVMLHNGNDGLHGNTLSDLTMEDTESSYNNWRGDRGGFYTWDVEKLLEVHRATITRHKSVGNLSRGFWIDGDSEDVVIDGAYSCNNKLDGIHIEAVQGPIMVKNSTFCDNGIHGVHLAAAVGVTLQNNIISGNGQRAIEIANGCRDDIFNFETGETYYLCPKSLTVLNNTISSSTISGDNGLLWWVRLYGTELSTFMSTSTFNNNTYHASADKAFKVSGYTPQVLTFSQWKSKTGKDGSSTF